MRKPLKTTVKSRKRWKPGQRVTTMGSGFWGTITRVIDRNTQHPIRKFKGDQRWAIYVLWDGKQNEQYALTKKLFREGEGNGFWGIQTEAK